MRKTDVGRVAPPVLALALGVASAPARAQPPPEAPAPPAPAPAPAPAPPGVPADEATVWEQPPGIEPEDVMLFVPRAILTIPRVTLKLVFWPIQKGLRFTERHALIEHVEDILYNDARTAGVLPTFSFLSSQGPSIGAKAFHRDLGGHGEALTFNARFGGRYLQAYELRFESNELLGSRYWVELLSRYEVQPRLFFAGFGDDAPELSGGTGLAPREGSVETRFRQRRMLALGGVGYTMGEPGKLAKVGVTAVLNNRKFGPADEDEDDTSIEEVYDTSLLTGFDPDRGAATFEIGGTFVADTRDAHGATSSGLYLELFGGAVPRFGRYSYGHFGGEMTGYIDLFRRTRVLVLRAMHEGVAFKDDGDIPFSDYPRLGGPRRLRGYALDRFRDELTAAVTAEYHYPIHEYIAGSLFLDAGRPAPDYAGLFEIEKWRLGGGGGFIVRSKREVLFTIHVAYGDSLNLYLTTDPLRAFDGRNEQL